METTAAADPLVLVLAEGDTSSAVNNARGQLFEQFVGRLLELHGYEEPRRDRINVTSNGIELDLRVRHHLTRQLAIVECKCYTTPVRAEPLTAFYGRLAAERFREPGAHGYFVAIPRLSPEGDEFARSVSTSDRSFSVLSAHDIVDALRERGQLPHDHPYHGRLVSDPAAVVTEHGVFWAGHRE